MSKDAPLTTREMNLLKMLDQQALVISRLKERIAQLERDSNNSNQLPSTDPPFKPKKRKPKKSKGTGKAGAKKGHKAFQRKPFPDERVDQHVVHAVPADELPAHLKPITGEDAFVIYQQISRIKAVVTEHKVQRYFNTQTRKHELAPHPKGLRKLLSAEAAATAAYLKTKGRMSVTGLRDLFRDILDIKVSRGCISQAVTEAGSACEQGYKDIHAALNRSTVIGCDETPHWYKGWRLWLWVAQTRALSFFCIDNHRSSEALSHLLKDGWSGTLVSDDFSAYNKWCKGKAVTRQLCHAHLEREVRGLAEHVRLDVRLWGQKLLNCYQFWWRSLKDGAKSQSERIWDWVEQISASPPNHKRCQNLAKRLIKHRRKLLRCVHDANIPATNNSSELALRQVVIQRKLTFGTHSENGVIAWERLWSVIDTCRKQKQSVYDYLAKSIRALREGIPLPYLQIAEA